jgi:hypothetical protein
MMGELIFDAAFLEDKPMEKQSLLQFVHFGTCVRFLQDASEGQLYHGDDYLKENLRHFFKSLVELDLEVTRNAAYDLIGLFQEFNKLPKEAKLTSEQAEKLCELMTDVRKTLDAELLTLSAYIVTPKVLDVRKLIDDVPALFGNGVFAALPDIARNDFSEAGKCIAFERPTAAAFHLLRGTESVLRNFYERMVRRQRIASRMWGPIVADLRKRPTGTKYAALYNNLDSIREHYRNPTQHPEKIYDISEAQDLWSLCIEVTNRMTHSLQDENR